MKQIKIISNVLIEFHQLICVSEELTNDENTLKQYVKMSTEDELQNKIEKTFGNNFTYRLINNKIHINYKIILKEN